MNTLESIKISEDKSNLTWTYNGEHVHINLENIGQAIEDKVQGKIVVSVCRGKWPYLIKVYSFSGEEIYSISEPKPYEFYYLKAHSDYGVSVICTSKESVDGRMDWQFVIDYSSGQLKRAAPSY
ncbi:hypothetical protein SAMN02745866_00911 [Alteromonadaceae bacterium Bs31]|nr:hypothetical protein SAMN02745866_00911 [Alteromonadaceae bacterium Bs31]